MTTPHIRFSTRMAVMDAIADPGSVTKRLCADDGLFETVEHWQARAAIDALFASLGDMDETMKRAARSNPANVTAADDRPTRSVIR